MITRRNFLKGVGIGAAAVAAMPLLPDLPALETVAAPAVVPPVTEAWSVGGFMPGDMFTIHGVFAKNPITGAETEHLQTFICTGVESSCEEMLKKAEPRFPLFDAAPDRNYAPLVSRVRAFGAWV